MHRFRSIEDESGEKPVGISLGHLLCMQGDEMLEDKEDKACPNTLGVRHEECESKQTISL